jgi:serpin B
MPRVFQNGSAQFGGMSPLPRYIGLGQHDAFVDVNEKGTEAAAATVVAMFGSGGPASQWPFVPSFRADRPFVFLIRDTVSRSILFVGRVTRPEA